MYIYASSLNATDLAIYIILYITFFLFFISAMTSNVFPSIVDHTDRLEPYFLNSQKLTKAQDGRNG